MASQILCSSALIAPPTHSAQTSIATSPGGLPVRLKSQGLLLVACTSFAVPVLFFHAVMAGDTRDSDGAAAPGPARKPPANIMPGGTAHTAGGEKIGAPGPGYWEVVRNLGPEYYLNFHKRPCIRDSQLQALSAGFAGGGIAAIAGRPVLIASNWAVATWCVTTVVSYQICQYYRSKEKEGMRMAHELMAQKRATMEAKKEFRRKAREESVRREDARIAQEQEEARRRSWKYWYEKNIKFW